MSGHPKINRISIFHALNHKAMARRAADQLGKPYALKLIVVHLEAASPWVHTAMGRWSM